MTRFQSAVVAVAIAIIGSAPTAAQTPQYRARLAPVPLDIAMQSTIAGGGSARATLQGSTLTITATFSGLKTPATVARLHRSPKTAMRGPAIGDLAMTAGTSGTISGTMELTKDQVDDLAAGRLYIQVHSQKAPDGNLWGWLLAAEQK